MKGNPEGKKNVEQEKTWARPFWATEKWTGKRWELGGETTNGRFFVDGAQITR